MNQFIARFQPMLSGVLTGFDRLVLRGTLPLNHAAGMKGYLWANHLGLRDFADHVEHISKQTKEASLAVMSAAGRPVQYLRSGKDDQQALAQKIALQDGVQGGPIWAFSAVESCSTYAIRGDRASHKIRLKRRFANVCSFISTGCIPCSAS
jgi:hypothetical protein